MVSFWQKCNEAPPRDYITMSVDEFCRQYKVLWQAMGWIWIEAGQDLYQTSDPKALAYFLVLDPGHELYKRSAIHSMYMQTTLFERPTVILTTEMVSPRIASAAMIHELSHATVNLRNMEIGLREKWIIKSALKKA